MRDLSDPIVDFVADVATVEKVEARRAVFEHRDRVCVNII
jgi:hypothetical protein